MVMIPFRFHRQCLVFLAVGAFLFINSCDVLPNDPDEPEDDPAVTPSGPPRNFSREFWGEWIRMDTGEAWYITSNAIKVNNLTFSTDAALVKQSARVIEVSDGSRTYYLYASRPATSNFSGSIWGDVFPAGTAGRAVGSGLGGINVTISNINDRTKTTTTTTDNEGKFTANGVIAGDEYAVKAGDQTTVVLPNVNGDDVGTITVTTGVNFKTSIKPKAYTLAAEADMTRLYANLFSYALSIEIENTGTVDCTAAVYKLKLDDDLVLNSGSPAGILGTIEPGRRRVIDLTLACKEIQNEYEIKKIGITIDDPISGKSWDDSVSIKFNKAPVEFVVRSNKPVSGVIIAPNARAYAFKTASADTFAKVFAASLAVPWSVQDYLVVFSGATADTEAVYSLGINTVPDTNFADFLDVAKYAGNNTEDNAAKIVLQDKIMSYLYKNAIQYFNINLGDTAPEYKPVTVTDYKIRAFNGKNNAQIYPGETHYLDTRVRNNTGATITIESMVFATTSGYVTISDSTSTRKIGILGSGCYKTLASSLYGDGDTAAASAILFSSTVGVLRFAVADCPPGTQIPFTVTFTDSSGNIWTDALTIPVAAPEADIKMLIEYAYDLKDNGNNDNKANSGETVYLDIRFYNNGVHQASGLQAVLATTNPYVTIDKGTADIGDLSATAGSRYKTLTDTAGAGKISPAYFYDNDVSKAFQFTVDGACPAGEQIPFTVTFTDVWGSVWTSALTIRVY